MSGQNPDEGDLGAAGKILQEGHFEALVSSATDAVASYGLEGVILTWNPAAEKLYGYPATEVIGHNIAEFFPLDAGGLGEVFRVGLRPGETRRFDAVRPHRDGSSLSVGVTIAPLVREGEVYGFVGTSHDISERVREQEGLRVREQQARSVIDTASDPFVAMDAAGRITDWNRAAEVTFGWTREEVVGQFASETIIPDRYRDAHRQGLARFLAGGEAHVLNTRIEIEALRRDGTEIQIELSIWQVAQAGDDSNRRFNAFLHDISERKRGEADLALARDQALEGSRAKSEFLATMSHEIRTPMNGVIGLTGLLLGTELTETQRRYANGVQGAGEALLVIIDDILDFSRLESGKVELETATFDPRRLVDDVGLLLAQPAAAKGLELVAYCDPALPGLLRGDAGRLRQVLLNLASNAVKFTATGEVVLRIAPAGGTPAGSESARVEFSVRDTGIGIDENSQEHLFEPFTQADASTTRRFGGTGLGLAICQRIVGAMGGQISIHSQLGSGSTFTFTVELPLGDPVEGSEGRLGPLPSARVLVVDDNETNRLVLSDQLAAWGVRPDLAESGEGALELLREAARNAIPYQAAILDLMMPEMSGLELAATITTDPLLAETALMILTSAGELDESAAREAGIGRWASKPVRCSELYDTLVDLLAGQPPHSILQEPTGVVISPRTPRTAPARGRVLVVEDNAVNQLVADAVLTQLGYEVQVVGNGRLALDLLAESSFDAVLMDCHMPELDGFETTQAIRAREAGEDAPPTRLPVIAMTAGVLGEDRARCTEAGMDDFVAKPIDIDLLRATLERHIPTREHLDS